MFGIWDFVKRFDFEPSKIDVFIDHELYEYDQEGNLTVTNTRYNVKKCNSSDYNTEYERNYWEVTKDKYHVYCLDDPNNSLSLYGPGNYDVLD